MLNSPAAKTNSGLNVQVGRSSHSILARVVINLAMGAAARGGFVQALQHVPSNQLPELSSVRASRPINVVGALADALLVKAFSAATLVLDCLFIALNDLLEPFADDFFIVRLAMLPPRVSDSP
jgi:hypothetical protein